MRAGRALSAHPTVTGAATALVESLTEDQLSMTVEAYLVQCCKERKAALKRDVSALCDDFAEKAKRARQALCDVGNQKSAADEPAPSEQEPSGALCDPFALVAIRGVHTGRIIKLEATEEKSSWSVGRSDDNDISLAGDDEVSSQHAQARSRAATAAHAAASCS